MLAQARPWDDGAVQQRWGGRALAGVAVAAWLLAAAGYVVHGRGHPRPPRRRALTTSPRIRPRRSCTARPCFSAATVGLVVAVRQRRHPVGWLFLALALALSVGAAGDAYALEHGVVRGRHRHRGRPGAGGGAGELHRLVRARRRRAAPDADGPTAVTSLGLRPGGYRCRRVGRPGGQGGPGHGLRPAVRRHAESVGGAVDRRAGRRRGGGRASRSRCSVWSWPRRPSSCGSGARRGGSASSCVGWH